MLSSSSSSAASVIKGEIHNLLSILRHVEVLENKNAFSLLRFEQEVLYNKNIHPLLAIFRELNDYLSNCSKVDVFAMVRPFCEAVMLQEMNAEVTGAALSSLHKFLLYGFLDDNDHFYSSSSSRGLSSSPSVTHGHHGDGLNDQSNNASHSGTNTSREAITLIARAIRRCTFEETNNRERDEEVVMKLLSLSSVVIRCDNVARLLSAANVFGIFETCLHVTQTKGASGLLRSAAGDALAHIVLVVSGSNFLSSSSKRRRGRHERSELEDEIHHGDDSSSIQSDDRWSNSDPMQTAPQLPMQMQMQSKSEASGGEQLARQGIRDDGMDSSIAVAVAAAVGDDNDDARVDIPVFSADVVDSDATTATTPVKKWEHNPLQFSNYTPMGTGGDSDDFMKDRRNKEGTPGSACGDDASSSLVLIMRRLSHLIDPRENNESVCILALTLINIALETAPASQIGQFPDLIEIMRHDLCKHLLLLSTWEDLNILSLTLRVIFNLFNSIKDHLKVQLEVFLTSVHLRILDGDQPELRELALESLLEFCQEPALMQDLYVNYDCDVQCTNLFESICKALANQASLTNSSNDGGDELSEDDQPVNILNRLALEGILAIIESIASHCKAPIPPGSGKDSNRAWFGPESRHSSSSSSFVAIDSDTESDASSVFGVGGATPSPAEYQWMQEAREKTGQMLKERKRKKQCLYLAATAFNKDPLKREWITYAESLSVLPKPATAESVAEFLFSTPKLDKTQIGLYLSKGPPEKYPFIQEVLKCFTKLFSFVGMEFSEALRSFLGRFRLPGEAQCIDRLMEAFSARLYEQCLSSDDSVFRNADAAFVLSFSTIMLNTDLHNPNLPDEKRMTIEQFIRNNRGINDGENIPEYFLRDLYSQIKGNEIQVQQDQTQGLLMSDEGILKLDEDGIFQKSVATPFFTPKNTARNTYFKASIQEKDMFTSISSSAISCMSSVFRRTKDDALVVKVLRGFQQVSQICVYFSMDELFNEVLMLLLDDARDYIVDAHMASGQDAIEPLQDKGNGPLPSAFLKASDPDNGVDAYFSGNIIVGSASHRGLLSLYCALTLVKAHSTIIREAWPILIDCMFALRDTKALPVSLSELDDFADSKGSVLPPSIFAKRSFDRWQDYMDFIASARDDDANVGLWESVTSVLAPKLPSEGNNGEREDRNKEESTASFTSVLALVVQSCALDQVLMQKRELPHAIRILRALLDATDPSIVGQYIDSPLFEHHAVFALELSARVLLSHRKRAHELYPMLLAKVRVALQGSQNKKTPYLMERACVTILRSCIHLFDKEEMRPLLLESLEMLATAPDFLMRQIADRVACGVAIILRGSYATLKSEAEWLLMRRLLDIAKFDSGRKIMFDGIASCIEFELNANSDAQYGLGPVGQKLFLDVLEEFVAGAYNGDTSLRIPAMNFMQALFYSFGLSENEIMWQKVAFSFYEASLSPHSETAKHAIECLQKLIFTTEVDAISETMWLTLYSEIIISRPPSLTRTKVRTSCLIILSRSLLITMPKLIKESKENWETMADIIAGVASMVRENISGRHDGILFESTVQHVTNMANVMALPEYDRGLGFSQWAADLLVSELEKVGAAGGIVRRAGNGKEINVVVKDKADVPTLGESNGFEEVTREGIIGTPSGEEVVEQRPPVEIYEESPAKPTKLNFKDVE